MRLIFECRGLYNVFPSSLKNVHKTNRYFLLSFFNIIRDFKSLHVGKKSSFFLIEKYFKNWYSAVLNLNPQFWTMFHCRIPMLKSKHFLKCRWKTASLLAIRWDLGLIIIIFFHTYFVHNVSRKWPVHPKFKPALRVLIFTMYFHLEVIVPLTINKKSILSARNLKNELRYRSEIFSNDRRHVLLVNKSFSRF